MKELLITAACVFALGMSYHVGKVTEYNSTFAKHKATQDRLTTLEAQNSHIERIHYKLVQLPVKAQRGRK